MDFVTSVTKRILDCCNPATVFAIILIIIMLFSEKFGKKFKYYGKVALFLIYMCFCSFICIPIFLLRPCDTRNVILWGYITKPLNYLLGIKWHIRNKEKIPPPGHPAILVCNHQTAFDALGHIHLWYKCNIACKTAIRKDFFWFWPVGLCMWLAGIIFIDRTPGSEKTRKQISNVIEMIRKDKIKMWMYAEGTRNSDPQKLLPFKKGAFRMAIQSQAPVVPIVISPYYFMNWKEKRFDSGDVYIDVLDPVPTEGLTMDDLNPFTQKVYDIMSKKNEELHREVRSFMNH